MGFLPTDAHFSFFFIIIIFLCSVIFLSIKRAAHKTKTGEQREAEIRKQKQEQNEQRNVKCNPSRRKCRPNVRPADGVGDWRLPGMLDVATASLQLATDHKKTEPRISSQSHKNQP